MLLSAKNRQKLLKIPLMRETTNLYVNISNLCFFHKVNKNKIFTNKIQNLKNNTPNNRCFIVGSGPSLTIEQLEKIKDEDSIAANRIYKLFDKTTWRPKYYVIQDPYDPTPPENYERLKVENLFVSDYYWKENGMNNPNAICYHSKRTLKQKKKLPFSKNIASHIQVAGTVTYSMIQMAVYFGYKEIYLIGMDHSYANETNDKGQIISRKNINSHVFKDEKPNEVVANISYMENAYNSAKDYCDKKGIKIYNATIGGKLEVFDRVDFWTLFNEKENKK